MQMTLPELIMASTILTWIVLSTAYRIRSNQKIFRKLDEIKKLLEKEDEPKNKTTSADWTVKLVKFDPKGDNDE